MNGRAWADVERLYDAALERAPADRAAFLDDACGENSALRNEVESLLDFENAAEGFLEKPALEEAAKALEADRWTFPERIGGYRVHSLIGAGGMGDVYRATDVRLGREVALKVLTRSAAGGPASLARFEEEARLASVLNHPNIVTIYGVGDEGDAAYIAMELVRGQTLRDRLAAGPLPVDAAVDLAVQLADALASAHGADIVHRDLKPENLMVTPEGRLKVLDFGLAKRHLSDAAGPVAVMDAARARSGAPALSPTSGSPEVTKTGTVLGTVGYMAPEQAAGSPATSASDQFAFGAILYEMLCGQRAFRRSSPEATLAALLREEPERVEKVNPAVPSSLGRIVARCTEKEPAARYASSQDLAAELRRSRSELGLRTGTTRRRVLWLGAGAVAVAATAVSYRFLRPVPGIQSLAILPFANASSDVSVDYACDGLTDELIRAIGALSPIAVKPRSAVLHFKGGRVDPVSAARQLAADAVVTGSVARKGDQLIVTASLLRASGARLWGATFERPLTEVLFLREDIAGAIADHVIPSQGGRRRLSANPTTDPAAYELYLRGIHSWHETTEAGYLEARKLLRLALARDGRFALAYVALATTYSVMAVDGYEPPKEAWAQVTQNVRRALDFDPELPDAHSEAAAALFFFQWDWAGSQQAFERAMSSRGGGFVPNFLVARALQEWALGRTEQGLRFIRRARVLDPLSPTFIVREADYLLQLGQLESAAGLYLRVIGTGADNGAWAGLAEVRRAQGRFDDAIEARRRGLEAANDDSLRAAFVNARGEEGWRQIEKAAVRQELEALRQRSSDGGYTSPLDYARAYARIGETERAFSYFEDAFRDRSPGLVLLKVDRVWDSIRRDPRFAAAVRRVGLPV